VRIRPWINRVSTSPTSDTRTQLSERREIWLLYACHCAIRSTSFICTFSDWAIGGREQVEFLKGQTIIAGWVVSRYELKDSLPDFQWRDATHEGDLFQSLFGGKHQIWKNYFANVGQQNNSAWTQLPSFNSISCFISENLNNCPRISGDLATLPRRSHRHLGWHFGVGWNQPSISVRFHGCPEGIRANKRASRRGLRSSSWQIWSQRSFRHQRACEKIQH